MPRRHPFTVANVLAGLIRPGRCEICGTTSWQVVLMPGRPRELRICLACHVERRELLARAGPR